jgi:hypothetical protein
MGVVMLATLVVCVILMLLAVFALVFDLDNGFDAPSLLGAVPILVFAGPVLYTAIEQGGVPYAITKYPTLSFGAILCGSLAVFCSIRILRRMVDSDRRA